MRKLLFIILLSVLTVIPVVCVGAHVYEREWEENNPTFIVTDSVAHEFSNSKEGGYVLDYGSVIVNDRWVGAYNPEYYPEGSRVNILMINGGTVPGAKIIIENGVTLVPARIVSETMGLKVSWSAESRSVTIASSNQSLQLAIGSDSAFLNGRKVNLPTPAKIINGSTYIPLRFISDCFGFKSGYSPYHYSQANNFIYFVTVDDFSKHPIISEEKALENVKTATRQKFGELIKGGFIENDNLADAMVNGIKYTSNIGRYNYYTMPHSGRDYPKVTEILINVYTGRVYYTVDFSLLYGSFSDDFGLDFQ